MTSRVAKQVVGEVGQPVSYVQAAAAANRQRSCPKWRSRFSVMAIDMPVRSPYGMALSFTLSLTVVLATLSGCVVTETTAPPNAAPALSDRVPIDTSWRIQAKVAATTAEGTETASVAWHRTETTRDTLVISGPLGLGSRTVMREGSELGWLDNGRMMPLTELSLEETHLRLIASLPIKDLALRLIGHGLDNTRDKDWRFSVASWQQLSGYTVPRKLRAQSAALSIDVVILSLTVESMP